MKQPNETAGATDALVPIQKIKVGQIVPDPKNRKDHDPAKIATLAESISADGLLQPILLRPEGDKFMIIAGERRWRAHVLLKRVEIEARVVATEPQLQSLRKRAAENFHREDLSPIEKAQVLAELFEAKMTTSEVVAFLGAKDQSTVSNFIRLLKLPVKVQALVHTGALTRAHGVALVRYAEWPKVCEAIAGEVVRAGISSKNLETELDWQTSRMLVENKIAANVDLYRFPNNKLPKELSSDKDFMTFGHRCLCFAPAKWNAIAAKLDAAEKAKEAATEKKLSTGKISATAAREATERRKLIAQNRQARTEASLARGTVLDHLAKTKEIDAAALAVIVKVAFGAHWRIAKMIGPVATGLGISLPKGFSDESLECLARLKPVDMLRLCAGAIALDSCESGIKASYGVEELEDVAHLVGAKKSAAIKKAATETLAGVARANAVKTKGAK